MYALQLLGADALAEIRRELASLAFVDGRESAEGVAAAGKRNSQLLKYDPAARALLLRLHAVLTNDRNIASIAFPKQIRNLIINKYEAGEAYDWHVDRSLMGTAPNVARSDLSFTLFLTPPSEYQGGELVIDSEAGQRAVKLEAGQMFIYPSHYLHRVNAITSGTRICAVGWIESWVADSLFRDTLWRLRRYMNDVKPSSNPGQVNAINEVFERLVKLASR
jgi:PKHD-type hydroxylase